MNHATRLPTALRRAMIGAALLWIGLLCLGCQPLLLDPEAPPQRIDQGDDGDPPTAFHDPGPPPVPDVAWEEAPDCAVQPQAGASVCARLFYRTAAALHELIWRGESITETVHTLDGVPDGLTSFSPDFSQLIVQTPGGHAAGGPLYLYDRASGALTNLNDYVKLPMYTGVSTLRVAGWQLDRQQLLLVNEDDEVVIWLDLAAGTYRPLALGIDPGTMSPPRAFSLAPDGSGFTFVAHSRAADRPSTDSRVQEDSRAQFEEQLYWYDLTTDQVKLLLTLSLAEGKLGATAIAPDGMQLAYMLFRGNRRSGRSEELYLLDLPVSEADTTQSNIPEADAAQADSGTDRQLLAGNWGPTVPVWSPDGAQIALIRRNLQEPRKAAPDQPLPLGDIWTISVADGTSKQLTMTAALLNPPVWSPDGRYLAFVTADSQIGMVAADTPGHVWRMATTTVPSRFLPIAFAPLEVP